MNSLSFFAYQVINALVHALSLFPVALIVLGDVLFEDMTRWKTNSQLFARQ
jgi:hypothetical protein